MTPALGQNATRRFAPSHGERTSHGALLQRANTPTWHVMPAPGGLGAQQKARLL